MIIKIRNTDCLCQRCGDKFSIEPHKRIEVHECKDGGLGKYIIIGESPEYDIEDTLDQFRENNLVSKATIEYWRSLGYHSIEQMKQIPDEELLSLRKFGRKMLAKIKGESVVYHQTSGGNVTCEICRKGIELDGTVRPKLNHYHNVHPEYLFYFRKVETGIPLYYKGMNLTNTAYYIFCSICEEKVMSYKGLVKHYQEKHPELIK